MTDPLSYIINRRAGQHGPVILMYHSVQPGNGIPEWPWAVSLPRLRSHLDFLSDQGWTTLTMANILGAPESCLERTVVLTFDDGYADNLVACEELHKRGMRATWFIVSGFIGQEPGWQADGRPRGRLLNSAELKSMHADDFEIGSHTVSHVRLTEMDETRTRAELVTSKAALEDILGNEVSSFAYPYGDWNEYCAHSVREAGYRGACTTRSGWALRDDDPFRLRRLAVFNTDTVGSLARKLYLGDNDGSWRRILRYARTRLATRLHGK